MALFLLLKHVFPTHVTMRKAPTKALDPVRQNFPWVRNDENHREGYCTIWDSNSTPLDSETSAFATGPFSPPAGHSFGEDSFGQATASECHGPPNPTPTLCFSQIFIHTNDALQARMFIIMPDGLKWLQPEHSDHENLPPSLCREVSDIQMFSSVP